MAIKAKFTVDNREIKKGLQEVDQQAKNTGNSIKSSMEQVNKGFDSAEKLGSKMGGTLKNLQEAFMGMLSPIGLITTGITALGALAVKVWDMMTVSAEEYAKKASNAVEKANKNLEETFKQKETDSGYLERLKELSQAENMSNAMKMEAAELISLLTKRYGDLGVSIDMATGKFFGLDEAQRIFLKSQQKMKVDAAQFNVNAQKMAVNSAVENALGIRNVNVSLTPFDFGDATKSINVIRANKWNLGGLEGKLAAANSMTQNATTTKNIEKWHKLAVEIEKLIFVQKELNFIVEYGERSEKAYAEALKKRSQQTISTTTYSNKQAAEQTKKSREQTQEKDYYTSLSNEGKLSYKESERIKELKKQKDLTNSIIENEENIKYLQEKQKEIESMTGKDIVYVDEEYLQISDEIAEINEFLAKKEVERQESLTKSYNIEKEIAALKKKSSDYYDSQKNYLNQEIDLAQMKLIGLNDEIEKYKLINDLKAKGITKDEKEIEAILKKQRQLGALNLQKDFKSQGEKMQVQAMKNAGFAKEAAQLEAIRNAEKVKGSKLTEDELDKIKQLMSLQMQMNDPTNKLNFSGLDTKTNELTSRGGFSSGAVITSKDTVNKQIRDFNQRQVQILNSIYNTLKTGGLI
uniref:Uncharacterized protein n=1 Tax=Myoviridae sp. ct8ME27 TaxID=2826622 RepID=A0A8S5N668_9CAUD|nr:MAG TPA: hypothetical protein [Myoviridae sp. ct8ME27]